MSEQTFQQWAIEALERAIYDDLRGRLGVGANISFAIHSDKLHWLGRVSLRHCFQAAIKETGVVAIYATTHQNKSQFEQTLDKSASMDHTYWVGDFGPGVLACSLKAAWLWMIHRDGKLPQ